MCVCVCLCVCVFILLKPYIYIYICIYIYVYIYIYIHLKSYTQRQKLLVMVGSLSMLSEIMSNSDQVGFSLPRLNSYIHVHMLSPSRYGQFLSNCYGINDYIYIYIYIYILI